MLIPGYRLLTVCLEAGKGTREEDKTGKKELNAYACMNLHLTEDTLFLQDLILRHLTLFYVHCNPR